MMDDTQTDLLTDDECRDEAVRAFDAALAARARRQRAVQEEAAARVERSAAEDAEHGAQEEMSFWEGVLVRRGILSLRQQVEL